MVQKMSNSKGKFFDAKWQVSRTPTCTRSDKSDIDFRILLCYDNSEPKSDSKNHKLTFNNLKNNEFVSNDFTGF